MKPLFLINLCANVQFVCNLNIQGRSKLSDTGQVTRTNNCWSWKRSFTLTSIFAVLEGARSPRHLACLNDKSRYGSRTVVWNGKRTKNWTTHREKIRNISTMCENHTITDITWVVPRSAILRQFSRHVKQKTSTCSALWNLKQTGSLVLNARVCLTFRGLYGMSLNCHELVHWKRYLIEGTLVRADHWLSALLHDSNPLLILLKKLIDTKFPSLC